jgi:hypothetical protein
MKFFLNALSNKKYSSFKEGQQNMSDSNGPKLTCTPTGCSKEDIDDSFNTSAFDVPEMAGGMMMLFFICVALFVVNFMVLPAILMFFGSNGDSTSVTNVIDIE